MAQVYGAGGKTLPKRGRNGTGSYWPQGTPIAQHQGSALSGAVIERITYPAISFGQPSRAGIATVVGQNRVQSTSLHPFQAEYNINTQILRPAQVPSSSVDENNLQPIPPSRSISLMPHERNTNSAGGEHKKPHTYRTVFGASTSMATDSAFERKPQAQYKRSAKPAPGPATEGTKVNVETRTFARVVKPVPVSGGLGKTANPRTPVPSFESNGNHWVDPHNSFVKGATTIAGPGTGRWNTIKRGVV